MAIAFQKVATPVWGNAGGSLTAVSASFTPNVAGSTLLAISGIWWQGNPVKAATMAGSGAIGSYTKLTTPGDVDDNSGDQFAAFTLIGSTASAQTDTTTTTATNMGVSWNHIWEYSGVASVTASFKDTGNQATGSTTVTGNAVTVPSGSVLVAYCVDVNNGTGSATITPSASGGVTPTTRDSATSTAFTGGFCVAEYVGTGTSVTPTFTTNHAEEHIVIQLLLTPTGGPATTNLSFSISTANTVAIIKGVRKTLGASTANTLVIKRGIAKTFPVSVATTTALSKAATRHLVLAIAVATSLSFSARRVFLQSFSVSTANTVSLSKRIGKVFSVATADTVALVRKIAKTFSVTAATTVAQSEKLSAFRTASVTGSSSVSFAQIKVRKLSFAISSACTVAFTKVKQLATVVSLSGGRKVIRQLYNFLTRR